MPRFRAAALLLAAAAAGCSPTLNWREVRAEPTALRAMFPCKPDKGARQVSMGGRVVELQGIGCDAGSATFALLHADIGDAARAADMLAQWNQATLAHLHARAPGQAPFVPPGADRLPTSQRVTAAGRRADGSAVQGEAAYFARGSHVFQAVVYGGQLRPEAVQPFFEGLKFP